MFVVFVPQVGRGMFMRNSAMQVPVRVDQVRRFQQSRVGQHLRRSSVGYHRPVFQHHRAFCNLSQYLQLVRRRDDRLPPVIPAFQQFDHLALAARVQGCGRQFRQAALKRRDRIEIRAVGLTEVERVLLRALAITDPENEPARRLAAETLDQQPTWFEHLGAFAAMQALTHRQANDPMDMVEDQAQKALLAEALLAETKPPEESEVRSAIQEIQERAVEKQQRDLRALIAEAERRGDHAELALLTQQKLDLDRSLRQLHNRKPLEG